MSVSLIHVTQPTECVRTNMGRTPAPVPVVFKSKMAMFAEVTQYRMIKISHCWIS